MIREGITENVIIVTFLNSQFGTLLQAENIYNQSIKGETVFQLVCVSFNYAMTNYLLELIKRNLLSFLFVLYGYNNYLAHLRKSSRKAKHVSDKERHLKILGGQASIAMEMEPLKNPELVEKKDLVNEHRENQARIGENEPIAEASAGWGTMLFNFFKILLLGVAVFVYDIYGTFYLVCKQII